MELKGFIIKLTNDYQGKTKFAYFPKKVNNLKDHNDYLVWLRNYLQEKKGRKRFNYIYEDNETK